MVRRRRARAGRSTFGNLVILVIIASALGMGYLFGLKWWHAQQMKEIARLVIREWHLSENEAVARDRLAREMKEYSIPYYIPDGACAFQLSDAGDKQLHCGWSADVVVPVLGDYLGEEAVTFPQSYDFMTEINTKGKVEQW